MVSKIADNIRKGCFFVAGVLNSVLPVLYYTNNPVPPELIVAVNVSNSLLLLIAERSNTIEKSIKEMRDDVKTLSNPNSSRSVPVVVSEPIAQEAEPVQQVDTARNYQRVRPVLNRTTGAIEYVADV